MFLISSCSCLCAIYWSQVLSWEWRCSWSSADRRCSNHIWVINNLIACQGGTYIGGLTLFTGKGKLTYYTRTALYFCSQCLVGSNTWLKAHMPTITTCKIVWTTTAGAVRTAHYKPWCPGCVTKVTQINLYLHTRRYNRWGEIFEGDMSIMKIF